MSGAELVRHLRESGTGLEKLAVARAALDPAQGGDPAADAAAVLAALDEHPRVPQATRDKARRIVADGKYVPPAGEKSGPQLEDLILAGQLPAAPKAEAPAEKPAPAEKKPAPAAKPAAPAAK